MAKVDRSQKLLAELNEVRAQGRTDAGLLRVLAGLKDKDFLVVSKATEIADAWGADELAEDMVRTFDRFVAIADPGCAVKERAAKALCEWGSPHGKAVFERGISLFQMEAVWGGEGGPWKVDVAAGVRGWCALGLAAMGHWDQVRLILPLLADTEPHARMMGARALAQGASDAGEALLRLKVIQGDAEEAVVAECLSGLAQGWPEKSVEFLVKLAQGEGDRAKSAMMALGESRSGEAWKALAEIYEADISPTRRHDVLGALAVSRREEAVGWMLKLVEDGAVGEAITAIEAMAVRKGEERVWGRVRAAVAAGGNKRVEEAMKRAEENTKS